MALERCRVEQVVRDELETYLTALNGCRVEQAIENMQRRRGCL
jgi:hypothetical protein